MKFQRSIFALILMVSSMNLNAQQDSLSCFGICDQFTAEARKYVDRLSQGVNRSLGQYANVADFNAGSSKFGITGNGSLGQLSMPPYNCASPASGKFGTGDFGLQPSYVVSANIFGRRADILDIRMQGKQKGYSSTPASDQNLKLSVKLIGIDILDKKNRAPEFQAKAEQLGQASANSLNQETADITPPKPAKEGTGGKLLDFSRRLSDQMGGQMPRVDIIPPVLYVGIDAGFTLQATLMFTYGVDSPFFSYRSTTSYQSKTSDGKSFCEAPVGGTDCKMTAVTTSQRGSDFYNDFKNAANSLKGSVENAQNSLTKARDELREMKQKEFYRDALALKENSTNEDGEAVDPRYMCDNIDSILRPIGNAREMIEAKIGAAQSVVSSVNQVYSSAADLYKRTEQAATMVGAVVNGDFKQIPEITADVAVRLNARASAWAQAVLALDAVVVKGYVGLEGRVLLVDASLGAGARLSTKSKYLDIYGEFQMVRLVAALDAIYGVSAGVPPMAIRYEGRKNLLAFQGFATAKNSTVARVDFRPPAGSSSFIWCGGIFGGQPSDPARCDDTPDGFSEVAPGLALHDRLKQDYFGEPTLSLTAGCIYRTSSGVPIGTSSNCADISKENELIIEAFDAHPDRFLTFYRTPSNNPALLIEKVGTGGSSRSLSSTKTINGFTLSEDGTFIPSSDTSADLSSENPADLLYTLPSVGIRYTDSDGSIKQAYADQPEFFLKVDGETYPSAERGDKKIFIGDLIHLKNQTLVELATNFRLGACSVIGEGNDKRINVLAQTYPKVDANLLSDADQIIAAAEGKISDLMSMPGVDCRLDGGGGDAFIACHLRKALAEGSCFPQDKVRELVYLANLSDEEVWDLFLNKKIEAYVAEDFSLQEGTNKGSNTWILEAKGSILQNMPRNASGIRIGCPTDSGEFSSWVPQYNNTPSPSIRYQKFSAFDRGFALNSYGYYSGSNWIRCGDGVLTNYEASFSSLQFGFKPKNDSTTSFKGNIRPITSQDQPVTNISDLPSYMASRFDTKLLADALRECVGGSGTDSCKLQLEGQELASVESTRQAEGSCSVFHGMTKVNSTPISASTPQDCLLKSSLTDLNLYCNSKNVFATSSETIVSVSIEFQSARTLGSDRSVVSAERIVVGDCRRSGNSSQSDRAIVGVENPNAFSQLQGTVSTTNSGTSIQTYVAQPPYLTADLSTPPNCQLLIGRSQGGVDQNQKLVFAAKYVVPPAENRCNMGGCFPESLDGGRTSTGRTICRDPDRECIDSVNESRRNFLSACFAPALNQSGTTEQEKLNRFCESLPIDFLKKVIPPNSLATTNGLILEIGLVQGKIPASASELQELSGGLSTTDSASGPSHKRSCQLSSAKLAALRESSCGVKLAQGNTSINVKIPQASGATCKSSIDLALLNVRSTLLTADLNRQVSGSAAYWDVWNSHICKGVYERPEALLFDQSQPLSVEYMGIDGSISPLSCTQTLANNPNASTPALMANSDCELGSWVVNSAGQGFHQPSTVRFAAEAGSCLNGHVALMSNPANKTLACEAIKLNYQASNSDSRIARDLATRLGWTLGSPAATNFLQVNVAHRLSRSGVTPGNWGDTSSITHDCEFMLIPAKSEDYSDWKSNRGAILTNWGSDAHPVRLVSRAEFSSYDQSFGQTLALTDSSTCIQQSESTQHPNYTSMSATFAADAKRCLVKELNQRIVFAGPSAKAIFKVPVLATVTCDQVLNAKDGLVNRIEADRSGIVKVWYRDIRTETERASLSVPNPISETAALTCQVPACDIGLFRNGALITSASSYLGQELTNLLTQRPTTVSGCLSLIESMYGLAANRSNNSLCSKIQNDVGLPSGVITARIKWGTSFQTTDIATCTISTEKKCRVAYVTNFEPGKPRTSSNRSIELRPITTATSLDACVSSITSEESSRRAMNRASQCADDLPAGSVFDRTGNYSLVASYGTILEQSTMRLIRKCPQAPVIKEIAEATNGELRLKHSAVVGDTEADAKLPFVFLERSTNERCDSYVPIYSSEIDQQTIGGFQVPTLNPVTTIAANGTRLTHTVSPGVGYCLRAWSARAPSNLKADLSLNRYEESARTVYRFSAPGRCEVEIDLGQGLPRVWIGTGALAEFGPFKGNYANIEGANNYHPNLDACVAKLTTLNQEQYEQGEQQPICSSFVTGSGELPTNRNSILLRVRMGNRTVNLPSQMNPLCESTISYPMIPNWGSDRDRRCAIVKSDSEEQYTTLNYSRLPVQDAWPRQTTRQVLSFTRGTTGAITPTYASSSQTLLLSDTFDECQRQTRKFGARICYLDYGPNLVSAASARITGDFLNKRTWVLEESCQYPSIQPLLSNGVQGLESWIDSSHARNVFKDETCTLRSSAGDKVSCLKDRLTGEAFKVPRGTTKSPTYGRLNDDNLRADRPHLLINPTSATWLSGNMRAKQVGSIFVVFRNSPAALFSTPYTTGAFSAPGVNSRGKANGAHGLLHGDTIHPPEAVLAARVRDNGLDLPKNWSFPTPRNYRIYSFNLASVLELPAELEHFLGTDRASPSRLINGGIAEVLLYRNQLNAADVEKIEGYLACKWGLQSELHPGHPYRLSACDPNLDVDTSVEKPDEPAPRDVLSKGDTIESIKIVASKEFCGSTIDLTAYKASKVQIGYCKEKPCSKDKIIFEESLDVEPGTPLVWKTQGFIENFGPDLLNSFLQKGSTELPILLTIDDKVQAVSVFFASGIEQGKECVQ